MEVDSQDNTGEKKSNPGGIIIPDFKIFYRVIETKTTWCWHKNKQGQGNRIVDPDINPHSYSQLFFKGAQNIWLEKRQPLQQMLLGKLNFCMQKTEIISKREVEEERD
jgi:hypothetical protein